MTIKKYLRVPYRLGFHRNKEIKFFVKVFKSYIQMDMNVLVFEKKNIEALNLPEAGEIITLILTFSKTVSYVVKNKIVLVFTDIEEGICYF